MRFAAVLPSSVRVTIASALTLASLSFATAGAHAESIAFFDTGVAANGSLLAAGSVDTHYNLTYSPAGVVQTSTATAANAAWTTASDAGWVSPGASGNQSWSAGSYVYEAALDLTGYQAATAVLSGLIASDDHVSIYLNGAQSASFTNSGFSSLTAFSINSGFTSGLNLVDFVVTNDGGPTGLLVSDAQATATGITPEPGSLYLLGTGLMGGLGAMARRYRS